MTDKEVTNKLLEQIHSSRELTEWLVDIVETLLATTDRVKQLLMPEEYEDWMCIQRAAADLRKVLHLMSAQEDGNKTMYVEKE